MFLIFWLYKAGLTDIKADKEIPANSMFIDKCFGEN